MHKVSQFRLDLATVYFRTSDKQLTPKFLQQLINVFADLYSQEFEKPKPLTSKHAAKAYHLFLETCADALLRFTAAVPPLCIEQPPHTTLLALKRDLFPELITEDDQLTPVAVGAYRQLVAPFRENKTVLESVGLFDWELYKPPSYVSLSADPGEFSDNYRVSWDHATDAVRNSWNRRVLRFQEARQKAEENAFNQLNVLQSATVGTPLFPQAFNLYPNEVVSVPFEIPSHLRFGHQFLVGASRSGKTTFLTAQLLEDLKRVERGECSVIVMDSQNEFVPNISKLALFGKGQPLGGKLVYLEPNEYPIAANIFSGDFRANFDSAQFFLNSIFKTDVTSQQTTMLKFALQALVHIPDATVSTLKELMEDGGYAKFQSYFSTLDRVVHAWIKNTLYSKEVSVTRTAVRNRLDGFLADPFFRAMFADPHDKLDLFEELKTPKVVLVNTADLGGALEPFGRFFIAKLDEAMLKRKKPGMQRLPVYCYIDEASDYIADEPLTAKVIDKLGKQMLGMIISIQRKVQIASPTVLDALEHVPIQAWTIRPPIVHISVDHQEPVAVTVSLIDLHTQPQMPAVEYEALRTEMRERYGSVQKEPEPLPRAEAAQQHKPEKPKVDTLKSEDETDAKPW